MVRNSAFGVPPNTSAMCGIDGAMVAVDMTVRLATSKSVTRRESAGAPLEALISAPASFASGCAYLAWLAKMDR